MAKSRQGTRIAFAILVLAPIGAAACDILKPKGTDAGEQPQATTTAVTTATAAPTAQPTATTTPLVAATTPVPMKVVKLKDGGTVEVPAATFDAAAFPNLATFDAASVPPLAVPGFDAAALPKMPTAMPSGFPTAIPGWPPPASTAK